MNSKTIWTVISSVLIGLVYFGIVMGICMGLVMFNANSSPNTVWFPIPAIALLIGAIVLAQRHWDIGLNHPAGVPWGRVYVVGTALTILGVATALVQGKYTGMVRETELLEVAVSPTFSITYAIFMSVLAAVLAEATFRGVIQTRMEKVLSVWPTVLIIGFVNVVAHRWGPEIINNWLGLFVTLAGWTYLRWLCQSLWPPMILHTLTNLIVAIALWYRGPLIHAELSNTTVITIAVIGIASLAVAIHQAKGIRAAK